MSIESFTVTYMAVVVGIIISVILPILRKMLPKPPQGLARLSWVDTARPYVVLGVFSLVVGLLIVASVGDNIDWRVGLLLGYAWDSSLQKLQNLETS